MTVQEILKLVDAGFTADEIRNIDGSAQPDLQPDPQPAPVPDPQPAPAPDPQPDPQPAPVPDPQPAPAPDPQPVPAAPQWFQDFLVRHNEDMAAMQRALQITNVRRAEPLEPQKTPEQLMAEAYRSIVE